MLIKHTPQHNGLTNFVLADFKSALKFIMYSQTKTSIFRISKRTLFGTVRRWINSSPGDGVTKNHSESMSSSEYGYVGRVVDTPRCITYPYINTLTCINHQLIHTSVHPYIHSFKQVMISVDDIPFCDLLQSGVFQQTTEKVALFKHRIICNAL